MDNPEEGRTLPHDIPAEQSVLGAMLISQDAYVMAGPLLKPEDFYRWQHAAIYKAITAISERGEMADLVTVCGELRRNGELDEVGGYSYLMDIAASIPTAANATYYASNVLDASRLRKMIRGAQTILEKAYSYPKDVSTFLDEAEGIVFSINQSSIQKDKADELKDVLISVWDSIETRSRNQDHVVGHPTGYYDLDYMLTGLYPSDLIILAARPAMGKTAFALEVSKNVAKATDLPVLFLSQEMSKEQLAQRMLCSEANVDSHRVKTGFLSESDWPKLSEALGSLSVLPFNIRDRAAVTVNDIRGQARRLMASTKQKLGLIVIDYLQLMASSNGKEGNRVQEISEISRGLKVLARELDVPVLALSQLSRAVEARADKRPMLSDLRESGSIEQDADIVMFIYRDEYYNHETADKNIAEIILAKHRNGPVGTIKLFYENSRTKFDNLKPDPLLSPL